MTRKLFLMVSVHDVAPAYWKQTKIILERLEGIGVNRRSLLVIPNFQGREPVSENPEFLEWLRKGQRGGDEIILHGYEHAGTGTPRTLKERLQARWQTQGEGEF